MVELETRPFEARFGSRCPFCGRTWGDPRPCGEGADWSIRDGLRLLFADRTSNCVVCDRQVKQGNKYCVACGLSVQRAKNREDRHRRVRATCERCGGTYERPSHKKEQRFCSLSCANSATRRKQFCRNGHDTHVFGRSSNGSCRECNRIHQRLRRAA